jgi:hypothetical protein
VIHGPADDGARRSDQAPSRRQLIAKRCADAGLPDIDLAIVVEGNGGVKTATGDSCAPIRRAVVTIALVGKACRTDRRRQSSGTNVANLHNRGESQASDDE